MLTAQEEQLLREALQPGESLRWAQRALAPSRRLGAVEWAVMGFASLAILFGLSWFVSCADFPFSIEGWARLQGVELVFACVNLLFSLLPAGYAAALGLTLILIACGVGSGRDCPFYVLTERRALILRPELPEPLPVRLWNLWRPVREYKLETQALTSGMAYQLAEEGGRGLLILHGKAEALFEPDGFCFKNLPDVRAAEAALLALIREPMPPAPMLPELDGTSREEREQVLALLCRGEQLQWATRPRPCYFPMAAWRQFFFFALFTAFALGMGALVCRPPQEFSVVGALVVGALTLVGVGGLLYPLWRKKQLARSLYLVTSRRALILAPRLFGGYRCAAFPLGADMVCARRTRADGSGDLDFSVCVRWNGRPYLQRGGFYNLPDLADAERRLDAARRVNDSR